MARTMIWHEGVPIGWTENVGAGWWHAGSEIYRSARRVRSEDEALKFLLDGYENAPDPLRDQLLVSIVHQNHHETEVEPLCPVCVAS